MRDEQRCIMWRHLLLSTNQSEIYWFLNGFCLKVVTHPSTKPARPGLTSELVCLPSLFLAKILSQTPPSPSSDFLLSVFSLYPRESCPAWIECCWSRIDDVFFLQNGPPFCHCTFLSSFSSKGQKPQFTSRPNFQLKKFYCCSLLQTIRPA